MKQDNKIIEVYLNGLPEIIQEYKESGRQSIQITVWLVGLSVAAIGFLANHLFTGNIPIPLFSVKCTLLSFVIVVILGILHRLTYHQAEALFVSSMTEFKGFLSGYSIGYNSEQAPPSNPWKIVAELVVPEDKTTNKSILEFINAFAGVPVNDIKASDSAEDYLKKIEYRTRERVSLGSRSFQFFYYACIAFVFALVFVITTIFITI